MADPAIIGAILTGAATLGGFVRWSAGRMAQSWDALGIVIERNTNALTRNSELMGRVDVRTEVVHDLVHDELSGVHSAAPVKPAIERKTPAQGVYSLTRSKTNG